jgi:hypothetical protein
MRRIRSPPVKQGSTDAVSIPAEPSVAEQWRVGHKWHASQAEQRVEVAKRCLRLIKPLVSLESVVDFGCGIGAWLAAAKQLGAGTITGFEGEWVVSSPLVIPRDRIQIVDLAQQSVDLRKHATLAMTIEVAEHLPSEAADRFVRTLVCASDIVLFSAALPGQGGSGHINERPLMYWVRKFWAHGYVPLDPIRPYVARDSYIFPWIRQNIVMFANYDVAVRSPELMRFARPMGDFSLHYAQNRDLGF